MATSIASARRFRHSPRPLFSNGEPFAVDEIPRIDSSGHPEQIVPVAVYRPGFLQAA